jgi:proteasome beta subunit
VTVVLSLVCADGVVLGADTQITDKERGMSYPGRKLHAMGDMAAWGGSGARSVLLELERIFDDDAREIVEADDIARALQQRVLPVLQYHYEHFIENVPGEKQGGTPSAYVLAAGYREGQPWIVEVNPRAMVNRYESIGFHAVGSGAAMAQQAGALLAHFRMMERPVEYGVLGIIRVLDALTTTVPSVGGAIDVCRITEEGAHHLEDKEIDRARKVIDRWRQKEQEALETLLD